NAPGYLFSGPGLLMFTIGVLGMGAAYFDLTLGATGFGLHSMLLASMLTLVGAQVTGFGVFSTVAADPIRRPTDPVTTRLLAAASLERVAGAGLLVTAAGGVYGLAMAAEWVASGFTQLPFVMGDVVAMTAVVLGIQLLFSAFFVQALTTGE
ncbi:MAG: glycosyltransferase family 2 protein, partial [Halanaeroarchaeum sp.]